MKTRIHPSVRNLAGLLLTLTVAIAGCGNSPSGTSQTGTMQVSVLLSTSATTVSAGTTIILAASTTPVAAAGNATFYDGTTVLGTASNTADGAWSLTPTLTTPGIHTLTAVYAGSSTYATATSNTLTITVTTSTSSAPIVTSGASHIYAAAGLTNGLGNNIVTFAASGTGAVQPTATLTLPTALLSLEGIATDSNGLIYAGGSNEIAIYAAGASGAATPNRTIGLPAGSSNVFGILTVDTTGLIYVAYTAYTGTVASYAIDVFSTTATGTATPIRQITGSLAQLTGVSGIAVDGSGNLYVNVYSSGSPYNGSILVFAPGATGNVAPTRVISGIATATTVGYAGLAVDLAGDIYTSSTSISTSASGAISAVGTVYEFGPNASGAATPIKTITGAATGLAYPVALSLDKAGNLYVMSWIVAGSTTTTTFTNNILGFGPTANGNSVPAVNFTSTAFTSSTGVLAIF